MPYYITKESIENEVVGIFKSAGVSDRCLQDLMTSIVEFNDDAMTNVDLITSIKSVNLSREKIETFSDMLFQLKDYRYYLKVVLTLFLSAGKYNEIAYLINRTFVNHIGDVYYISGKNYDYSERYFDRFIEAVKYTNISQELILDFIFYINKANQNEVCSRYLRPSKEYIKAYILENEAKYFEYISTSEEKYSLGLKLFIEQYTEKGLNLIIEKYVNFEIEYESVVEDIVKEYKHEALNIIEKHLANPNTENKLKALNLLKLFKNDVQINNFVEKYYNKLDDDIVKREIKSNFLNATNIAFVTVDDFKSYVANKQIGVIDISLPQNYPMLYSNGERIDEVVESYIFSAMKDIDKPFKLKDHEYLKNILDITSANIVANRLYEEYVYSKIITTSNLWVINFIVLFASENTIGEVVSLIKANMIDTVSKNYVYELFAEFNNDQILRIIKEDYKENPTDELKNILKVFARQNNISVDDYIDSLVDDYGLNAEAKRDIYFNGNYLILNVTNNLNVEVIDYATKTNYYISKDMVTSDENYFLYILKLKKEIKDQIQRLKDAFYDFRLWDISQFENNILSNSLMCKIASTCTWGYYKGNKLVSVFRIVDGSIKIVLNNIDKDETYKIGLVHPVELDQNREIISSIDFEPFNQLRRGIYNISSNEYTLSRVSNFTGMLANYKYFIDFLRLHDWSNGLEVLGNLKSLIKRYPNENIFCEISFEKVDTDTISISDIRFYNLSSTTTQGNYFIINKNDSLLLSVIPKRTYSNVLDEICQACFN